MAKNALFFGDNLEVLRNPKHFPDASVDMVYLDPPFKSEENYNVLFREPGGSPSAAQIRAFEDTWRWDETAQESYEEILATGPTRVAEFMRIMRSFLGRNDMMAYLAMMAPRLVELHRVLKPTGALYLHCDPNASHYLKLLLDAIFGVQHFRREIVWRIGWVSGFKTRVSNWVRNHETIFYYTKSDEYVFNKQYKPYAEGYERRGTGRPDGPGIPFEDVFNVGDEPLNLNSIMIMSFSTEKMSYPTQKPLNLLKLLIRASTNEGDVVLDPFCGCGTTIVAAHQERRRWLGIDVTHLAIGLNRYRLQASFGSQVHREYTVVGEPRDVAGARALAEQDRYDFEWWFVGAVSGRAHPNDRKKGADRGIDGIIYFTDGQDVSTKRLILQVKSGRVTVKEIRELRGVVESHQAEMGAMLCLESPTKDAKQEAVTAGSYVSPLTHRRYSKLQILTAEDLFAGRSLEHPPDVVLPSGKRLSREKQETLAFDQGAADD